MRSKFSRILAGLLAFVMVLVHTGAAVPAYAAEEQAQTSPSATQGTVLTATQSMVDSTGILTISGEWDRIVVPKELTAISIFFKDVQADVIEIESGLTCRIVLVSGSIGEVAIIPAKITQLNVQTLIQMFKGAEDPQTVADEYNAIKAQNDIYLNNRPTLVTQDDVAVANISVSGNAKLNLADGDISNITIHADGSQTDLDVDISNYNGSLSVSQTNREDEKWMIARVTLKNSTIENLVADGDGHGNIILDGKNSSVTEVTVDHSAMVSLDVPASKVEIPESAGHVNLTVLDNVDDISVSGDGSSVAVGNCGTVTNAIVEGNDVTISGNGTLTDVKIIGSGVAVSTPDTKVEGENTYVPPVITTPDTPVTPPGGAEPGARDLGGLELVMVGWSEYYDDSPEYAAQQAYREEMMKKHNFTVRYVHVTELMENCHDTGTVLETISALGSPVGHVFLLDGVGYANSALSDHAHLFYNLATLSELDFTEDKWNSTVTDLMTFKNGIYGMAVDTDMDAPVPDEFYGILYNKDLFEAAGLDPELPYTLQANGEWTWSKFKEICEQLTMDINEDGTTDIYAMCSRPDYLISQLVVSAGGQFIDVQNGRFVNTLASEEVLSALTYAKELYDAGYDCYGMDENYNWIDPYDVFQTGAAAMQFAWLSLTYPEMEDSIGYVCCPKPDDANSYQVKAAPSYVAVIPAFYDAKTASDIAFAYNLWTNQAPEYAESEDAWKSLYQDDNRDKAIEETFSLYYEANLGIAPYSLLSNADAGRTCDDFWNFLNDGMAPSEILQMSHLLEEYDGYVTALNTASVPRVTINTTPYTLPYTLRLNSDGTLTVTGCTNQNITEVVIPSNINGKAVTAIGESAFYDFYSLTSVTLPSTLRGIGDYAFGRCPMLDNVVVPDSVTSIGSYAFTDCGSLKTITLPDSVETMGEGVISWCSMLESVVIPEGLTTIGWVDFYGCNALKNITLPSSVVDIVSWAFDSCPSDLTLTVEENSYAEAFALQYNFNVAYSNSDSTPVRDLGGMNIVIGDYFTRDWECDSPDRSNPEQEALYAYRQAMMKKYNFTITQVEIADYYTIEEAFESAVLSGAPEAQVYILHPRAYDGNTDLFYDLSTLSEFDFSEGKWSAATKELMSYHGGIYGMALDAGLDCWGNVAYTNNISGILFNRRLFAEAGLDPDLPYDLQASGQWTWSKFEEICAQLTRDTDEDGVTDIYALASDDSDMLSQLILSTGEQFVELDANGNFVNNTNSGKIREAFEYALSLSDAGYIRPRVEDFATDYYQIPFQNGVIAMQFTGNWATLENSIPSYFNMEDELGFVCCPKSDDASSYQLEMSTMLAVIPSCYDAETAANIAFAYNLWTNPAPGYEESGPEGCNYALDDRAINETFALCFENGLGVIPYSVLLADDLDEGNALLKYFPFDREGFTLDDSLPKTISRYDELVADANN